MLNYVMKRQRDQGPGFWETVTQSDKMLRGVSPIKSALEGGANLVIVLLDAMALAWPDFDYTLVSLRATA